MMYRGRLEEFMNVAPTCKSMMPENEARVLRIPGPSNPPNQKVDHLKTPSKDSTKTLPQEGLGTIRTQKEADFVKNNEKTAAFHHAGKQISFSRRGSTGMYTHKLNESGKRLGQDPLRHSMHVTSTPHQEPKWQGKRSLSRSYSLGGKALGSALTLDGPSEHQSAVRRARSFAQERKLGHDTRASRGGPYYDPNMEYAVRKRGAKQLLKSNQAAIRVQTIIRGWLARVRVHGRERCGFSLEKAKAIRGHYSKSVPSKGTRKVVSKGTKKVVLKTKSDCSRRKNLQGSSPVISSNVVTSRKPSAQKSNKIAAPLALQRKEKSIVQGVLYEQNFKDMEYGNTLSKCSPTDLEKELCMGFKSNFAKKAARARRASCV